MVEIINISNKETIKKLGSALTFEGLTINQDSLNALMNWLKGYTEMKHERVYIIKGAIMNTIYNHTKVNMYPDDLNIVCVDLNDMKEPDKITLPRFDVGGRWLDDVIENNLMHNN